MKVLSIKCPECGATINLNQQKRECFCAYCGSKLILDDGSHTITHTHVYIDKTKEQEIQFAEKVLAQEKAKHQENKQTLKFCAFAYIITTICAIITFLIIKEDFDITINFTIMLIGCLCAISRILKNKSTFGSIFVSFISSGACIAFLFVRDDFDTSFTLTIAVIVILNIIAGIFKKE